MAELSAGAWANGRAAVDVTLPPGFWWGD